MPPVFIVMLFVTVIVLAVPPLNSKEPEAPVPTVKELQAAFAFLIRMFIPFGITTLSVAVGTPLGLHLLAVLQAPLEMAVFVVCEKSPAFKRTKIVINKSLFICNGFFLLLFKTANPLRIETILVNVVNFSV
jgi:hypothetical protein